MGQGKDKHKVKSRAPTIREEDGETDGTIGIDGKFPGMFPIFSAFRSVL
jgi:hypothetical protein